MNNELVFAYISDIGRNIINKGFSFSNQFEVDYSNDKLSIKKNIKTPLKFFGNNITNINLIVGENGTGKTSILDLIGRSIEENDQCFHDLVHGDCTQIAWFLLYYVEENTFYIESKGDFFWNQNPSFEKYVSFVYDFDKDHYDFDKDHIEKLKNQGNFLNEEEFAKKLKIIYKPIINNTNWYTTLCRYGWTDINYNFIEHGSKVKNIVNEPSQVDIYNTITTMKKSITALANVSLAIKIRDTGNDFINSKDIFEIINQKVSQDELWFNTLNQTITRYLAFFIFKISESDYIDRNKVLQHLTEMNTMNLENCTRDIMNYIYSNVTNLMIQKYVNFLEQHIYQFISNMQDLSDETKFPNFSAMTFNNSRFFSMPIQTYNEYVNSFLQTIDKIKSYEDKVLKEHKQETSNIRIIKKISFSKYFNINYTNLSSGEMDFIENHASINTAINTATSNLKTQTIILLLDEPDLTFHPEWSRQYIQNLITLLENHEKINFQIILTTHSPFIISDIPKKNIISLKQNCLDNKIKIEIHKNNSGFASNFYDIINKTFLLESPMGEFAKLTCNNIIKDINTIKDIRDLDQKKSKINKLSNMIFLISDDLLKSKLLSMLEEQAENLYLKNDKESLINYYQDCITKLQGDD